MMMMTEEEEERVEKKIIIIHTTTLCAFNLHQSLLHKCSRAVGGDNFSCVVKYNFS